MFDVLHLFQCHAHCTFAVLHLPQCSMFQLLVLILLHLFQCRAHCTSAVAALAQCSCGIATALHSALPPPLPPTKHLPPKCHPTPPTTHPPHPPPTPPHHSTPLHPHTRPPHCPTTPHPTTPPRPAHPPTPHPHPHPTYYPQNPCLPTISDPQSLHLTKISALIIIPGPPHYYYYPQFQSLRLSAPNQLITRNPKPTTPFGAKPINNPQPKAYAFPCQTKNLRCLFLQQSSHASPPSHPQPSRLPPPLSTLHLFGAQLHFASAVVHSSSAVALIQCSHALCQCFGALVSVLSAHAPMHCSSACVTQR